ncbi:Uma2 family endonuclease [bacterium]|nr:Uma2 family endonuclease [bacterium]
MSAITCQGKPFQTSQWQSATWDDYVYLRDDPTLEQSRLFFNQGWLWIGMGSEGINHASISDLLTSLLFIWAMAHPELKCSSLGRCQLDQTGIRSAAPDLVLYLGDSLPQWSGEGSRYLNLDRVRAPDLVGEISDTTLSIDLDEKKQIYASLGIAEYWVINIRGQQVIMFQLQESGFYQECQTSPTLSGLSARLLEQTLERLDQEPNTAAALWFSQQLTSQ